MGCHSLQSGVARRHDHTIRPASSEKVGGGVREVLPVRARLGLSLVERRSSLNRLRTPEWPSPAGLLLACPPLLPSKSACSSASLQTAIPPAVSSCRSVQKRLGTGSTLRAAQFICDLEILDSKRDRGHYSTTTLPPFIARNLYWRGCEEGLFGGKRPMAADSLSNAK